MKRRKGRKKDRWVREMTGKAWGRKVAQMSADFNPLEDATFPIKLKPFGERQWHPVMKEGALEK